VTPCPRTKSGVFISFLDNFYSLVASAKFVQIIPALLSTLGDLISDAKSRLFVAGPSNKLQAPETGLFIVAERQKI
jgi:hypothetical protein